MTLTGLRAKQVHDLRLRAQVADDRAAKLSERATLIRALLEQRPWWRMLSRWLLIREYRHLEDEADRYRRDAELLVWRISVEKRLP